MAEVKPDKSDRKRVTLREVAQEAGVSLKTASNVINHSGRMADATREKVQDVIDRLGYRVNVSARNLNRGKTGFITLAVPSLTAPYLAELANRSDRRGPHLRLFRVHHHVCGRIRAGCPRAVAKLQCHGVGRHDPVHLRSRGSRSRGLGRGLSAGLRGRAVHAWQGGPCHPDDVREARLAAQYLFDHGATNLAVIGSRTDPEHILELRDAVEGNAQLRMRGIFEACADQGVELDTRLVPNVGEIGPSARARA